MNTLVHVSNAGTGVHANRFKYARSFSSPFRSRHESQRAAAVWSKALSKMPNTERRCSVVWAQGTTEAALVWTADELHKTHKDGPIIVWFKHDLRTDDNPGLAAALSCGRPIIPLYCFDPRTTGHLLRKPCAMEGLRLAVSQLRESLRNLGTDLVIRSGNWEDVLPAIAYFTGASEIMLEDEVEYRWLEGRQRVARQLPDGVKMTAWKLSIWEDAPYSNNYRVFTASRGTPVPPLPPPEKLPPLPTWIASGDLPDLDDMCTLASAFESSRLTADVFSVSCTLSSVDEDDLMDSCDWLSRVHEGEGAVVDAFRAYMRYLEYPRPDGYNHLYSAVEQLESNPATPSGSFRAIFEDALSLGVLSRRRVYHEAMPYMEDNVLKAQNQFRWPRTYQAAAQTAEAWEYYWHMALNDQLRPSQAGDIPVLHWRWRGVLTDYISAGPSGWQYSHYVAGSTEDSHKPAILLVHGFGAFCEQWRGQLKPMADAGYQVFAATFPGYGRSEKPAIAYSQDLWRDFLRDFVCEVVRRPVVVVGNSIGGYISASLAADYPALVKGLVLMNSAGQIVPGYTPPPVPPPPSKPPPALLINTLSTAIFWFLETSIARQLARLYPTDTSRADEWLAGEIFRAACDPGALGVFRSVFYLPKPRPLNYLVDTLFCGPTLVLQGALDPLNDAKSRAEALRQACSNVQLQLVQAGHCPHDEVPGIVNRIILDFVVQSVVKGEEAEGSIEKHTESMVC